MPEPTPAMVGAGPRWEQDPHEPETWDYRMSNTRLLGWVEPAGRCWRAYFVRPGAAPLRIANHPTEDAARAWVEEQVAGREIGGGTEP